jgi:hypothetical protein
MGCIHCRLCGILPAPKSFQAADGFEQQSCHLWCYLVEGFSSHPFLQKPAYLYKMCHFNHKKSNKFKSLTMYPGFFLHSPFAAHSSHIVCMLAHIPGSGNGTCFSLRLFKYSSPTVTGDSISVGTLPGHEVAIETNFVQFIHIMWQIYRNSPAVKLY